MKKTATELFNKSIINLKHENSDLVCYEKLSRKPLTLGFLNRDILASNNIKKFGLGQNQANAKVVQ